MLIRTHCAFILLRALNTTTRHATAQAMSKEEEAPGAEAARKRLADRLAAAEEQRQQRLAAATQRARSKVQHAKVRL